MAQGYIRNRIWHATPHAPRTASAASDTRPCAAPSAQAQARLNEILHFLNKGDYREPITLTGAE